jgi:hypothetical protein
VKGTSHPCMLEVKSGEQDVCSALAPDCQTLSLSAYECLALRSRDLDGREQSGLRQAAVTKRPCSSQIDNSTSIPFGRKRKMGFACQS